MILREDTGVETRVHALGEKEWRGGGHTVNGMSVIICASVKILSCSEPSSSIGKIRVELRVELRGGSWILHAPPS